MIDPRHLTALLSAATPEIRLSISELDLHGSERFYRAAREHTPALLLVYEAACVWRDALAKVPRPSDADVALATAIDSTRTKPSLSDRRKAHGFPDMPDEERGENLEAHLDDSARGGK